MKYKTLTLRATSVVRPMANGRHACESIIGCPYDIQSLIIQKKLVKVA
jgi:hypothetical protein